MLKMPLSGSVDVAGRAAVIPAKRGCALPLRDYEEAGRVWSRLNGCWRDSYGSFIEIHARSRLRTQTRTLLKRQQCADRALRESERLNSSAETKSMSSERRGYIQSSYLSAALTAQTAEIVKTKARQIASATIKNLSLHLITHFQR